MINEKTGELVGFARVSTKDQNLNLQLDALKTAGCTNVFYTKESGAKEEILLR